LSAGQIKGADVFARDEARPLVFTIDTALFNDLNQTFFQFREKSVLSFPAEAISWLSLETEDLNIKLSKDTSGTWFSADSAQARSWKISGILSALRLLEARRFIDESALKPEKYGLGKSTSRVLAGNEQETIIDLVLGARLKDEVYLHDRKTNRIVTITADKLKEIFPAADEIFEEKRIDN